MVGHSVISNVSFSIANDADTVKNSYVEVTVHEMYNSAGQAITQGVYDPRMGTTDHGQLCATCYENKKRCPGHFGHINLKTGVICSFAVNVVRKWLKIICFDCGSLLAPNLDKYKAMPVSKRMGAMAADIPDWAQCPECRAVHPIVKKDENDSFTFLVVMPGEDKKKTGNKQIGTILWPDAMKIAFSRVTDATIAFFGIPQSSHPANLIISVLPVPPNTIRPGVKSFGGTGGTSYHDITNLIQNLCKRTTSLPNHIQETMTIPNQTHDKEIEKSLENLGLIYYNLTYGSSSTSATQGNSGKRGLMHGGRQLSSLLRVIQEKKGRIRSLLLGCRTFNISRTTISGNSRLKLNEVAIPYAFARTLQVEEIVQEYNYDILNVFYMNGKKTYPGSTRILKKTTGMIHDINEHIRGRLEIGDRLFRDVVDGDLFYFNRQPTLEISSIGVHQVVVIKDPSIHTFQINVCACEGYNADFDGDQMNGWVARHAAARAEAALMSSITNWFISTKTSGPVNGQVQDSVVGSYELTKSSTKMDKFHAIAMFADADTSLPDFSVYRKDHIFDGRSVVSLLLEKTPINYSRAPSMYDEMYVPFISYDKNDIKVVIENGKILSGVLDKKAIGAKSSDGIFHLISNEYGPLVAMKSIYSYQQLVLKYITATGFTVSMADLMISPESREQINLQVSAVRRESQEITDRLIRGEIIPPIGQTVRKFYESMQLNALKVSDSVVFRWLFDGIDVNTNCLFKMITSGSKGKVVNFMHIISAIGQSTINDNRMEEKLTYGRSLIYFPRFETEPVAHGFVSSNYIDGMSVPEFTAQGQKGRDDLVRKALTTAKTGNFTRVGIMNLQSMIVDHFLRVVKHTRIAQFIYGDDGMDPRKIIRVQIRIASMSAADMSKLTIEMGGEIQATINAHYEQIIKDKRTFIATRIKLERSDFTQRVATDVLLPINVKRSVDAILINSKSGTYKNNAKDMAEKLRIVQELIDTIPYIYLNDNMRLRRKAIPPHLVAATKNAVIHIRSELCPAVIAKLTVEQVEKVRRDVYYKYQMARVDPGSAVGMKAVQAVSEPMTQGMLDSHHSSIVSGSGNDSLVRIDEIFKVKPIEQEGNPSMILPIKKTALGDDPMATARELANDMECVLLKGFTTSYDIILEAPSKLVYPVYLDDMTWINEYIESHPTNIMSEDTTNWCIRFSIDKSALVLKNIELIAIVKKLHIVFPKSYIVHTAENVTEIVIRMWINNGLMGKCNSEITRIQEIATKILNTPIRGIEGIIGATAKKFIRTALDENGELTKEDVYSVVTRGTNLYQGMIFPNINTQEVISNSVLDTYRMFGIEAARMKIINETRALMGDNTPNIRHVYLFADEMTRLGTITGIQASGLAVRERGNTLLRMGYSAPINVLADATLKNAKDAVYGVAAPQLLGAQPQIGTMYSDYVVNTDFIAKNYKSVGSMLDNLQ